MAETIKHAKVIFGTEDKALLNELRKIRATLKDMGGTAKQTNTEIKDSNTKTSNSFTNLKNSILKTASAYIGLRAGFNVLKESTMLAVDAEESHSKFLTVFKNESKEAIAAAKDLADNWGLSTQASESMLSAAGDLLMGLGLNSKAALDLSVQTNQLAIDLASFTNFAGGAEGAASALVKAYTGERESVKALGIIITEEMVKEELLRVGKEKLIGAARLQARAEATYAIAVRQSKNAIGDFARTSQSAANQMRIFGAITDDLKVTLGNAFVKVLLPQFKNLINSIKENRTEIEAFATNAGKAIGDFVKLVIDVGKFLYEWRDVIIVVGKVWLTYFAINKIKAIGTAFMTSISKMGGGLTGLIGSLKSVGAAMIIAFAVDRVTKAIGLIKDLSKESDKFAERQKTYIQTFESQYKNAENQIEETSKRLKLQNKLTKENSKNLTVISAKFRLIGMTIKDPNDKIIAMQRLLYDIRKGKFGKELAENFDVVKVNTGKTSENIKELNKELQNTGKFDVKQSFIEPEQDELLKNIIKGNAELNKELAEQKIIREAIAKHFSKKSEKDLNTQEKIKKGIKEETERRKENIKAIEDQIKAVEDQRKAYESLNEKMGILTAQGYRELLENSSELLPIWKENKTEILNNQKVLEIWLKEITETNKAIKESGRIVPEENLKIENSLKKAVQSWKNLSEATKEQTHNLSRELPESAKKTLDAKNKLILALVRGKKVTDEQKKGYEDLQKALDEIKFNKFQKQIDKIAPSVFAIIDSISDMGLISGKMGENFKEAFGGVANVLTNLKKPIDETFTKFDKFKAVAGGVATAVGGLFGASDKTKQALQGIGSGIANIMKGDLLQKIAGGFQVLTGVLKLFAGDGVGEAIRRENAWMKLTKEQTEALRKLEKEVGNTHAATSLMLNEFVAGQVTLKNSDKWLHRIRETLIDIQRGTLSATDGVDAMGKSFKVWLEQAKKLGTTGTKEFFGFIDDLKKQGLEVAEISEFMMESFKTGLEGYKKMKEAITGGEKVSEDIEDLNTQLRDLNEKLRGLRAGSKEYVETTQKIKDVTSELEILKQKLSDITTVQKIFGDLNIKVFDDIIAAEKVAAENKPLFDAINGMNQALLNFSNTTKLTQAQVTDFGMAATKSYEALIEKGVDSGVALATISPTLMRLKQLQSEFNYEIDDGTQALIDEADSLGLLKADPINRMADAMDRFIALLTDKFGLGIKDAKDGIDGLVGSVDRLGQNIKNLPSIDIGGSGDFSGMLGPGAATGAKFVVPPGFENDTFPMRVSSGEPVIVGKKGQSLDDISNSGATFGDMNITNIINESQNGYNTITNIIHGLQTNDQNILGEFARAGFNITKRAS